MSDPVILGAYIVFAAAGFFVVAVLAQWWARR